ncbi:MAG: DNA-directed RNA polymerase subunit beta [bacterium]
MKTATLAKQRSIPRTARVVDRQSFHKVKRTIDVPKLLEHQYDSYKWFCEKGIFEVFDRMFPIPADDKSPARLEFLDFKLDEPPHSWERCKERSLTFARPLYVTLRLISRETGEIKEQSVFIGDIPAMTERATFVINGAERVVVSQLIRSPGLYFKDVFDLRGRRLFTARVVPNRGTWLETGFDTNGNIFGRIGKTRRLAITTILTALGFQIDDEAITHRPISIAVDNVAKNLISWKAPFSIIDQKTGELLHRAFDTIDEAQTRHIEKLPDRTFTFELPVKPLPLEGALRNTWRKDPFKTKNEALREIYICLRPNESDPTPDVAWEYLKNRLFNKKNYDLSEVGRFQINNKLQLEVIPVTERSLTMVDILEVLRRLLVIQEEGGPSDDIDHLGNRRVRCVGELTLEALRTGLHKMERSVREKLQVQDIDILTPQMLINTKALMTPLRNFFNTGRLTQFLDQTNPLAELTHKRRLSAMGPGGLTRDRAGFEVRDVHHSHYGKVCPIETPEGPNIGLITSLATYAHINHHGFLETPYFPVVHGRVQPNIEYLTADAEDRSRIAESITPLDANGQIIPEWVSARYKGTLIWLKHDEIDHIDASPGQIMGVSASLIPFLEHDDANRALMGANMLRQAVPLLRPEPAYVGTGLERRTAEDSGYLIFAEGNGEVERVTGNEIVIRYNDRKKPVHYKLFRYKRSNQGTIIDQKAIVRRGDKVKKGDNLVDAQGIASREISLGRNLIVAFMPMDGYNFEDAVVVSEGLVKDDSFTSIHIEDYEAETRKTKMGKELVTRDIPNVPEELLKNLDERGIVRIGTVVRSSDILVGKITPKPATEKSPEEMLLWKITGSRLQDYKHTSKKLPHGVSGWVTDSQIFEEDKGDELPVGVEKLVRVYVAIKRKLQTGDKLAGRHGNKGVIGKILPLEDMPYLADGTPVDIIFSPLCVPSRMNLGQLLETHLGWAAAKHGFYAECKIFDGAREDEIRRLLKDAGLPDDGKVKLFDGKTGLPLEEPVTVGMMYVMKLYHLAADKIHARSTGTYTLVTQQPLGGKAQFGGQRFGEMEVWALEAYGASEILQEMLTIKSDDIEGRRRAYEAIVKGRDLPDHRIPESFYVLVKELKGLGIDVRFYKRLPRVEGAGGAA